MSPLLLHVCRGADREGVLCVLSSAFRNMNSMAKIAPNFHVKLPNSVFRAGVFKEIHTVTIACLRFQPRWVFARRHGHRSWATARVFHSRALIPECPTRNSCLMLFRTPGYFFLPVPGRQYNHGDPTYQCLFRPRCSRSQYGQYKWIPCK